MKLTKKNTSILLSAFILFSACGSTDTVKSTDVKQEAIYQQWHMVHQQQSNSIKLTAQFRVGGFTGTTVAFTQDDQVILDGKKAQFVDGDKVNQAMDILNIFSVVPLFNLLKTGTFYYQNVSDSKDTYSGKLTDDDGTSFNYTIPKLSIAPISDLPLSYAPRQELNLSFTYNHVTPYPSQRCNLKIKGRDNNGHESTEYFSGKTRSSDDHTFSCIVKPDREIAWENFFQFELEVVIDELVKSEKQVKVNTSSVWGHSGKINH